MAERSRLPCPRRDRAATANAFRRCSVLVVDLLGSIPAQTRDRVADANKRHGTAIREAIRGELRFKAQWTDPETQEQYSSHCPVETDRIGHPQRIGHLEVPSGAEFAACLAHLLPTLTRLVLAGEQVVEQLPSLVIAPPAGLDLGSGLDNVRRGTEFARHLKTLVDATDYDLAQHILSVQEDILGCYQYPSRESFAQSERWPFEPSGSREYPRFASSSIVLYWGVIGLVSACIDVSVEAMTCVTLAHELGHYYTHMGFDRDGHRWLSQEFAATDPYLVEGLAQYYTARVVQRLRQRVDGLEIAYERLLAKQSGPYRAHEEWLTAASPEGVGATLASVRRQGPAGHGQFTAALQGAGLSTQGR